MTPSHPMSALLSQPKIDCHCHILDPAGFTYHPSVAYRPTGQETGSADYFDQLLQTYGVHHALLVQPNSGYGPDNSAMLDAMARYPSRFKGIAIVPLDASIDQLQELKALGIVGAAFNVALLGPAYYGDLAPRLDKLRQAGLFAQIQVEGDQLAGLVAPLRDSGVQVLIDHCGRPQLADGPRAAGVEALLGLAETGRVTVKLSGFAKFSQQAYPFADCLGPVAALLKTFGSANCVWASDWPFLKAPYRMDYGTLLHLLATQVPDPADQRQILWDTPRRLFDF